MDKKILNLLIISHTPHYTLGSTVVGWGPTVCEINQLGRIFDKIVHIAPLHGGQAPSTAHAYAGNITFEAIQPFGGKGVVNKMAIWQALAAIVGLLKKYRTLSPVVHVRLPMSPAVLLLPWLKLFFRQNFWFKYAGNMDQRHPPASYFIQRMLLKYLFRNSIITCNGSTRPLPRNHLHFENPCLTAENIQAGLREFRQKDFSGQLHIIFVGHIAANKGVYRIIDMLKLLPREVQASIGELTFAGDGETARLQEKAKAARFPFRVEIKGGLPRPELNRIYSTAHVILLPSRSEGFPKVIAEAAAYGCVPAVSDVSALGKYINETNGLIFPQLVVADMASRFAGLIKHRDQLRSKALNVLRLAPLFTYDRYLQRIKREVLTRL